MPRNLNQIVRSWIRLLIPTYCTVHVNNSLCTKEMCLNSNTKSMEKLIPSFRFWPCFTASFFWLWLIVFFLILLCSFCFMIMLCSFNFSDYGLQLLFSDFASCFTTWLCSFCFLTLLYSFFSSWLYSFCFLTLLYSFFRRGYAASVFWLCFTVSIFTARDFSFVQK